ncbi:MAG TPA: 2,3-bisphosphoglycerate-independent phosphoglycerate mutase [Candidatus Polarisedimenticolia bacterium]|nr:2,3-bisphosphoglycerate-independent phosphoglycerate mutase [Candidatus Polarisedimenticolia bacterium]
MSRGTSTKHLPMALLVLDGWGVSDRTEGNAILASGAPFMTRLKREWPSSTLAAAGEAVGLPPGYIGNSEVGHLCLGAGRVVHQDLQRINRAISEGDLDRNEVLLRAMTEASRPGAALHLMGLLSDGGVHSHIAHAEALVDVAKRHGVSRLFFHAFLDGRDTPPKSALGYVDRMESRLKNAGYPPFATVIGRYYAMDRDKRWERTERAWRALALREGTAAASAAAAVRASYDRGVDDEFVEPAILEPAGALATGSAAPAGGGTGAGPRTAAVRDGDVILFFNFRADRARQITRAFTERGFDSFRRSTPPVLADFVCLTTYDRTWSLPVAFPPQTIRGTFGEAVAAANLPQLRIAETEKYAHVTYFFNGGVEQPFPGEERCLVPSPKVATYDLQPEMSAREVAAEASKRLQAKPGLAMVLNFANADMVGHTGKMEATIEACRVVDRSVEAVVSTVLALGGVAVVTADHGNAESMIDSTTGGPVTAHTMNRVPVHVVGHGLEGKRLRDGGLLADVAPTMLAIMGLPVPKEMEGRSLLL